METHIWHAKRFKMETRWGVRYPVRCSDKSDRSTYRLVQRDSACIMDKSYFSTIELTFANAEKLVEACEQLFDLVIPSDVETKPVYRTVQLREKHSGELIAPIELLVLKSKLLITVHPSAAE